MRIKNLESRIKLIFCALFIILIALFWPGSVAAASPRPTPKPTASLAPVSTSATQCKSQIVNMKNDFINLLSLSQVMFSQLEDIQLKVESYYTTKMVPLNKTAPNYDELIADVQSNNTRIKQKIKTVIQTAQEAKCSGGVLDKGRELVDGFRDIIRFLDLYKGSLRNLVTTLIAVNNLTPVQPSPVATVFPQSSLAPSDSPLSSTSPRSQPIPTPVASPTPKSAPITSTQPVAL